MKKMTWLLAAMILMGPATVSAGVTSQTAKPKVKHILTKLLHLASGPVRPQTEDCRGWDEIVHDGSTTKKVRIVQHCYPVHDHFKSYSTGCMCD